MSIFKSLSGNAFDSKRDANRQLHYKLRKVTTERSFFDSELKSELVTEIAVWITVACLLLLSM